MLERATACLKAGARDSLQCAHHATARASRAASRRRLHSTFWTHGAGDIDLDIVAWGLGQNPPANLPLRHDDSIHPARRTGRRERRDTGTETETEMEAHAAVEAIPASSSSAPPCPDVPFLDFLYPPQALAWLQRSNGQPWERWERRNARRLPEGFVQASRGYSSRSRPRSPETGYDGSRSADASSSSGLGGARVDQADAPAPLKGTKPKEKLCDDNAVASGQGRSQDSSDPLHAPRTQSVSDRIGNPQVEITQSVHELVPSAPSVEAGDLRTNDDDSFDTPSAIGAGELGELAAQDFDHPPSPLEALQKIMRGRRRVQDTQNIDRVWQLYMSLSETQKADPRLMHELLLWFAYMDAETAQAHSISLFWSIPVGARTLADYEAVLSAFLKRKTYDAAAGVHKEALENIPNGYQITKILFRKAMDMSNWWLALKVKSDHDRAFEGDGPAQARQKALFWINVAEIPDLTLKARYLAQKCRWLLRLPKRQTIAKYAALGAMSASISEEAFRQYLLSPWRWPPSKFQDLKMTRGHLLILLDSIRLWSPNAPGIFEEFLAKLLAMNVSEDEYRQAHIVVYYIYGHYRQMPGIRPSEQLLQDLLSRVLPYSIDKQKLEVSEHDVSIETIVEDWQSHHKVLSCWAVKKLMAYYARLTMPEQLASYYAYLQRYYPSYQEQEDILWALIYVHALQGDTQQAREAFNHVDKITRSNRSSPDVKCWSNLMHAHARADDLVGGLDTLNHMVEHAKLVPNTYTVHPLLNMLAARGDVEGIADLLEQYDSLTGGIKHSTSFVGSRMLASIHNGEVLEAELILKDAVKKVYGREILGSLTTWFNILIGAYARRKDIDGTMRTYRWMKEERIRLDRQTYTALMLGLVNFRQTIAAETVMMKVMLKEGFEPTAIHYAIVMVGYKQQDMYQAALRVHNSMLKHNVRPSRATRTVYLQVLAMKAMKEGKAVDSNDEPAPIMDVINELYKALDTDDGSEVVSKDPTIYRDPIGGQTGELALAIIADVISIHGEHKCIEAVQQLFKMYQDEATKLGRANAVPPMRVLLAMMTTHLSSGNYAQVEAYWKIAKDHADHFAPPTAVPDYLRQESSRVAATNGIPQRRILTVAPPAEADRAEIGFEAGLVTSTQGAGTLLPSSLPRMGPKPSPGRKYLLSQPLRNYIHALAAQNRITDVLKTFTALVRQGYAFDVVTWNRLIEHLCKASPPLALLAFTLTERYLIAQFPGWDLGRYRAGSGPRKSAMKQNLQFIRGRYYSYETLVPQYRTIVHLTAALSKLRRWESAGIAKPEGEVGRFMGSLRQIEAMAPKTLQVVNSLPRIEGDDWQYKLLRSDEAKEG